MKLLITSYNSSVAGEVANLIGHLSGTTAVELSSDRVLGVPLLSALTLPPEYLLYSSDYPPIDMVDFPIPTLQLIEPFPVAFRRSSSHDADLSFFAESKPKTLFKLFSNWHLHNHIVIGSFINSLQVEALPRKPSESLVVLSRAGRFEAKKGMEEVVEGIGKALRLSYEPDPEVAALLDNFTTHIQNKTNPFES
jgi:hypothetical protein